MNITKGCPTNQQYLELGQVPARFEIQKMRLLYLKYILNQDEDSLLQKFFLLQLKKRSKGDWAWTCIQDLKELNISESLDEIKQMTLYRLTKLERNVWQKAIHICTKIVFLWVFLV